MNRIVVNVEEWRSKQREEEKKRNCTNISAIRSKKRENWNHKKEWKMKTGSESWKKS